MKKIYFRKIFFFLDFINALSYICQRFTPKFIVGKKKRDKKHEKERHEKEKHENERKENGN